LAIEKIIKRNHIHVSIRARFPEARHFVGYVHISNLSEANDVGKSGCKHACVCMVRDMALRARGNVMCRAHTHICVMILRTKTDLSNSLGRKRALCVKGFDFQEMRDFVII